MALFIMLLEVGLAFNSMDKTLVCSHSKYFYVLLFIMLYKVALTLNFMDRTLVCDHSKERY